MEEQVDDPYYNEYDVDQMEKNQQYMWDWLCLLRILQLLNFQDTSETTR